jgi:anti-sigma regulatory factor (Ser/Thr protein kinase)
METVLSATLRQVAVEVGDTSAVGAARRLTADICRQLGFDESTSGTASLIATEAATNIIKHAGNGEMLIRPLPAAGGGIEILAIDSGPGMPDVAGSMQDGTTTAGSYGIGLGTMRRSADHFDIYTQAGKGTVISMTIYGNRSAAASQIADIGVVCVPMRGETVCGDAWAIAAEPTLMTILVADGLGHGPLAAEASELAGRVIAGAPDTLPGPAMQDIHLALRPTRGAAVAVARLDLLKETVQFAGIGNIMASIYEGGNRRQMVSYNGIVGHNVYKIQEFPYDWSQYSLLILCSDGIGTRWDLQQYPGLAQCHPSIIAGVLYRDFVRRRDDATVLVIRESRN